MMVCRPSNRLDTLSGLDECDVIGYISPDVDVFDHYGQPEAKSCLDSESSLSQLHDQVSKLIAKVASLQSRVSDLEKAEQREVKPTKTSADLAALLEFTEQLFGEVKVEVSQDQDASDAERYVVFSVNSDLASDEIVDREVKWAKACRELSPHLHSIRLLIL